MLEFLTAFGLFYFVSSLLPILAISYLVLSLVHGSWLLIISILHPNVEFLQTTTVRTLLDTLRNQGIVSLLLCVKGQIQPEAVRRHLHELVRRRDKAGNLTFPRLRHCLVTRCGVYAWEKGHFDLDLNLMVAPVSYKSRTVTEYNIQEYVSEFISKHLPQNVPPWQMVLIPSSQEQHYILLKLHHVLLSEGINIGDLLPLIPPTRPGGGLNIPQSPLVYVLRKPQAVPKLRQYLNEEFSNSWNEFVSKYDPLECLDLLKKSPGIFEFQAILFISFISAIKESIKGSQLIRPDLYSRCKFVLLTLQKQCIKREVTLTRFGKTILVTLDPRNIFQLLLHITKNASMFPFKMIFNLLREVIAMYLYYKESYCPYKGTVVGSLYNYVPLIADCFQEVFYYFKIIFEAPRTIVNDILFQKESFQTVTLCGRKSVACSDPVRTDLIRALAMKSGSSEIEVMLAAISACISKYFIQTKFIIPDYLPVSMRSINSNYIFGTGPNIRAENSVSGILCMNIPLLDPEKETTIIDNLNDIRSNFRHSIEKQGLSHLLSFCQARFGFLTKVLPLSVLAVYLRYLSRKYAVSITEVTSRYPNMAQKTIWGQEVSSAIYWWPPQANSSVSLCLNEYADHVKLAVMCDSQLAPYHPLFVRGFQEHLQELAKSFNIPMQ